MTATECYSLLLKNGRLIDPANGRDARLDLALSGEAIAAVAPDIPACRAAHVLDVAGHLVVPGLIDIHTHVHPFVPTPDSYVESVHADAHLRAGLQRL